MINLNNFLEYDMIIWLVNEDDRGLKNKWSDFEEEQPIQENNGREERIVKYSFDATMVSAYRQTFVRYKDMWHEAVVCHLEPEYIETPPLLVSYDKFVQDLKALKEKLDGDNQKEIEITERRV